MEHTDICIPVSALTDDGLVLAPDEFGVLVKGALWCAIHRVDFRRADFIIRRQFALALGPETVWESLKLKGAVSTREDGAFRLHWPATGWCIRTLVEADYKDLEIVDDLDAGEVSP